MDETYRLGGRNVQIVGNVLFEKAVREFVHIRFERRKVEFANDVEIRTAVFDNFRKVRLHDRNVRLLAAQLDFTARLLKKYNLGQGAHLFFGTRLLKKYGLCQRAHLFFGKSDRFRKICPYQSVESDGITIVALSLFKLDKPLYFGINRIFEIDKIAVGVGVGTKFRLVDLLGERF